MNSRKRINISLPAWIDDVNMLIMYNYVVQQYISQLLLFQQTFRTTGEISRYKRH